MYKRSQHRFPMQCHLGVALAGSGWHDLRQLFGTIRFGKQTLAQKFVDGGAKKVLGSGGGQILGNTKSKARGIKVGVEIARTWTVPG